MSKMRAVQVTRPNGPLEIVEREIPEPGVGQVRVRVDACGICHSDSMTIEGIWPGIEYPRVPGHEIAGVVAELLRAANELALEGVVAKRKGSLYEPGRSSGAWVKYKIHQSQEFVIGGYTAGNPFDALIVGCYEAGSLKYVGKVRNGFVPHMRCAMMPLLYRFLTDECPFADLPEKRRTWYSLTRNEMNK